MTSHLLEALKICLTFKVFIVLFLHSKHSAKLRLRSRQYETLLIPFFQVIALSIATFTAVSRIMDYKHHPTDVLAGFLIGVVSQSLNFLAVIGFNCTETDTIESIEVNELNSPLLRDDDHAGDQSDTRRRRITTYYDSIDVEI